MGSAHIGVRIHSFIHLLGAAKLLVYIDPSEGICPPMELAVKLLNFSSRREVSGKLRDTEDVIEGDKFF
jgi:hypothetical protein